VLEIASQLAGPLIEAHDAGVTHRDLKPDNIFLTRGPGGELQLKVLDFGVAQVEERESQQGRRLTAHGMVFGTPEYMAPEQARGETVGPATDLYAVGVMLYELLTGELPIQGESPMDTMMAQVTTPVKDIRELVEIPNSVARVVHELLRKAPEDRLNDAREFKRRLQKIRTDEGIWPLGELPEGDLGFVLETAYVEPGEAVQTAEPQRAQAVSAPDTGPPIWLMTLLLAIALCLAVALGYVLGM
jgi:serine/threonine-protein kinase